MLKGVLDFCNTEKKIFCYGAGEYGRTTKLFLEGMGINVSGFVVSKLNPDAPNRVLSIPIYQLSDFPFDYSKSSFLISLRPSYQDEILKELERRGAKDIYKISTEEISLMKDNIDLTGINIDRNGVMVLLYHRIISLENDYWKIATSPELFEKEIKYLKDNYNILKIGDDWTKASEKSIVVTFDDGYFDNYINALPILEKYNVPATFFISTANIGTGNEFWWDKLVNIVFTSKMEGKVLFKDFEIDVSTTDFKDETCKLLHNRLKKMTHIEREKELDEIADILMSDYSPSDVNRSVTSDELQKMDTLDCVTIGGHTVSHGCMAYLTYEDCKKEICLSKTVIEEIVGHEIYDFSYPFGGIDDRGTYSSEILSESGYFTVSTTSAGVNRNNLEDKKAIMRNTVSADIRNMDDFIKFIDLTYAMSDGCCV